MNGIDPGAGGDIGDTGAGALTEGGGGGTPGAPPLISEPPVPEGLVAPPMDCEDAPPSPVNE